jgi:hypothetical protein
MEPIRYPQTHGTMDETELENSNYIHVIYQKPQIGVFTCKTVIKTYVLSDIDVPNMV